MFFDDDSNGVIAHLELGFQEWSAGRLETLDCYEIFDTDTISCNLSVSLPENLSALDSLRILDLQNNNLQGNLTGSLIESLVGLSNFVKFNVNENQFSGYLHENICNDEGEVRIESFLFGGNQFCPCYPECIAPYVGEQDTSACSYCNDDYTQICDRYPDTVTILEGDSLCFKSDNLDVLEAFIDSSLASFPDSLDMRMDADSSGTIEPLELGTQYWEDENLVSLDAKGKGLSGQIPSILDSLESLQVIWLYNNFFSGQIPESICSLSNLEWDSTGSSSSKSYLYSNQLCPPYPDCIAPFVGEQNTLNCSESESP